MQRRIPLTSPLTGAPVVELSRRITGARRTERTLGLVLWVALFAVIFGRF